MRSARSVLLDVLLAWLFMAGHGVAADLEARTRYGASPHSGAGDCALCHVAAAEKLRGWFVLGSTKRELKGGAVEVCSTCHGFGFGHAIGKQPAVNHKGLPLAENGTITCALTCHNMHIIADDPVQTFYHLRLPADALCVSCHDN